MVKPTVKVDVPKIKINTPKDQKFWRLVGLEITKDIFKRTLSGKDADNRPFKKYAPSTLKQRVKRGRSANVNLVDTGKMLGSMARGIRAKKTGVSIKITGEQGKKAWIINEIQKREFFALSDKQVKRVIKSVKAWMKRKNK